MSPAATSWTLEANCVAVLVNVLHGHRAENGAQVAFQGLRRDTLDVVNGLAQELLGGGGDGDVVAFDFDLGHAIHLHRHAFAGIDLRRLHINGQQLQGEHVHLLEHRDDERAAAFDDAKAARLHPCHPARHICACVRKRSRHLVRPDFGVTTGPNGQEDENARLPCRATTMAMAPTFGNSARRGGRFIMCS